MASTTIAAFPPSSNPYPRPTSSSQHSHHRALSFASNQSNHDTVTGQVLPASSAPAPSPSPYNQNSQMSFSMSQGSQGNGLMMQPGAYRQFADQNAPSMSVPAPQIYSAVYSGVDVYEMEVNRIAVMRRRNDSWLNATQILKVAGIEKGKRTKVLEKEILIGEHEKVQGGYGKYQGTWIKFEKGLEFCRQYGVEEILRPLLTYDMGQDGGIAGHGGVDTPTKEQAMAANRKRLYNAGNEARLSGQSGTFFKNISSTASHAVAAISKARFDSPAPRIRNGNRPPSFSRQSSQQQLDENAFPGSQQSMQSFASESSYNMNGDSAYATQNGPHFSHMGSQNEFQEPPRKRVRQTPSINLSQQTDAFYDMREPSPTEPNDSFVYHQHAQNTLQDDVVPMPLPPLPFSSSQPAESKRALLMSLFMDQTRNEFSRHEAFVSLSGEDLDMPIDNTAHTALHWAATLARLPLLRALINSGASIYRVNNAGETALMRACAVTNNLDFSAFPDLLELLGPTIEMKDGRGRTVLHHIAVTSAVKGRSQASKYYLESLLEFVVRQGSAPSSQQMFLGQAPTVKSMGIGRFMSEIVNAQDKSGDTALNIAARVGNRSIISQLLEVGADAGIPNRAGLRPVDFGIGDPTEVGERPSTTVDKSLNKATRENSGDVISSITTLLSQTEAEFAQEMTAKQSAIDSIHTQLRSSSAHLGEERRRLERLQHLAKARDERKCKITNLRRAGDEEAFRLQQIKAQHTPLAGQSEDMYLGEADVAFACLPENVGPDEVLRNPALVATIPGHGTLRARVAAYRANNERLERAVGELRSKSRELEVKYRKTISLCTRVPEERIDDVLEGLWRAVDSEGGDVELGRVREFLTRVEGVE
ncbi:transcriptional regulator swi6 [Pseudogymnoascus verrucosus]|uniref:Transcription factor SWI6 n=1 Tax=Pseudogymnoascus verrucosus TaxID=342668 RepID=A0A1B8GFI7_9PEZI|nr:transcriptional regulator swi6 [Pseudogymnoascus verrucosus]OBT94573.1 transcriptional regulator swi6 [Pseudogymnoascus verrucosus]